MKAETAVLELEEVRVDGVVSAAPPGYAGTIVHVYSDWDGSVRLGAKRPPEWVWDERFEP